MKVQPRIESSPAKVESSSFPDERPRMFGANCDDFVFHNEEYSETEFLARWWPGEMDNRVAPRKPR